MHKTIVGGRAHAVFNGKVLVREGASVLLVDKDPARAQNTIVTGSPAAISDGIATVAPLDHGSPGAARGALRAARRAGAARWSRP